MATVLKVIPAFQYSRIFCRAFPNVVPAPQHFFLRFTPPPTFLKKNAKKKWPPDSQRGVRRPTKLFSKYFQTFFSPQNYQKKCKKKWPPDSQTGARRPNKSLSKLEEQIGKHGISLSGS